MKKILFLPALLVLFIAGIGAQETLLIAAPKTVSSLPIFELEGRIIGGAKVHVETFDDHALALARLIQGKVQFLATGFSQGYYHGIDSKDIQHVSTFVWGVSSLISSDANFKSLKDFTGKTILVPFAKSPLDLQLRALIFAQGLEGKIKVNYAPIPQQVALLTQKKAEGITIPEPLASKMVLQNQGYEVFTFARAWKDLTGDERSPQVSLFASRSFLGGPGAAAARELKNAMNLSIAQINKDPDAYGKKYASMFALPAEVLVRGLKNTLVQIPSSSQERQLIQVYLEKTGDKKGLIPEVLFE